MNALAPLHPLSPTFFKRNILKIQAALASQALDGILLLDQHNVIYASGFYHSPSERPIGLFIPAAGAVTLFIPLLEQENAESSGIQDIRTYFEYPGTEHPVVWMVKESACKRLAVDSLSYADVQQLSASGFNPQLNPLVQTLRYRKEPEELTLIRHAARYADYCLEVVLQESADIIKRGGSELDILNTCISATQHKLKTTLPDAFTALPNGVTGTIHSGPRAALPHGKTSARQPQKQETIIAGIGVNIAGYHAESGATFITGTPNQDQLHCLNAAVRCNDAAIHALHAGTRCDHINELALNELKQAGLSNAIRHRIGHGMGLQGHEAPWLAPGDPTKLECGMVFSNEPGIYRAGLDGYRTINSMIVTDGGAEVVSRFLSEHLPEQRVIAL